MQENDVNWKRCQTCKLKKPIRDFQFPRHRTCTECHTLRNTRENLRWHQAVTSQQDDAPSVPAVNPDWEAVRAWSNQRGGFDPSQALTSTLEGYNKYQREIRRARAIAKIEARERERARKGLPPKVTPLDAPPRLCMRCRHILARSLFPNPRARICIACDGPPLSFAKSPIRRS